MGPWLYWSEIGLAVWRVSLDCLEAVEYDIAL